MSASKTTGGSYSVIFNRNVSECAAVANAGPTGGGSVFNGAIATV